MGLNPCRTLLGHKLDLKFIYITHAMMQPQRNQGTRRTTAQQIADISNDENVTLVAKGGKGVVAVAKKAFKTGDFILRMSHPKVYRTLREAIIGALASHPFLYGLYLDAQKGLCWQTEVFYDLFIKVEGSEGDLW